jgi:rhodanese-related sulfurtransferase
MLIVDTMPLEDSYKKQHIPGAAQMEFPIDEMKEMDASTRERFEKLLGPDRNRMIVFYCGFTKCTRSHNGAMWAAKLGYANVHRGPGGIKAWLNDPAHLGTFTAGTATALPSGVNWVSEMVVARMDPDGIPDVVFGQGNAARLVLVTCGGKFNASTRHYTDNIVVVGLPQA